MASRQEERQAWEALSHNSRKAAQHLLDLACYRSSVSRSYYAAYAAITGVLAGNGANFADGNNPTHALLPVYVLNNLTELSQSARYEVNKSIRCLFAARVEADYIASAVQDRAVAVGALRK